MPVVVVVVVGVDGRVVIVAEQVVVVADCRCHGDHVLDIDDRVVVVVTDRRRRQWYTVVVVVHMLWRWCDQRMVVAVDAWWW